MLPGVTVSVGMLASTPASFRVVRDEFFGKVFELPFVPSEWIAQVRAALASAPLDYFHILPVLNFPANRPAWLDTPEKIAAWDAVAQLQIATLRKLAHAWGTAQAQVYLSEMRSIHRWASIREKAIAVATTIRDLPKTVVAEVGNLASGIAVSGLAAFLPLLLIAGLGFAVFLTVRQKIRE